MTSLLLGILIHVIVVYADVKNLNIWPMPSSVSHGYNTLYIAKDFKLRTYQSKYADASGILKDGFTKLVDIIKGAHVIDYNYPGSSSSAILQGIHVIVASPSDEVFLYITCPTSYKLLLYIISPASILCL